MATRATAVELALCLAVNASADEGDDTLRAYLSKSEFVVAGEIQSEVNGISSEAGVVRLSFDFKIRAVLMGGEPRSGDIRVEIVRFEIFPEDELPWVKKGAKAILFLRKAPEGDRPEWTSADMWFGVQPPNRKMERSLKRLAAEAEDKKASAKR